MSAYVFMWVAIVAAGLLAWLTKFLGHLLPQSWVEHARLQRIASLVTVALLAALAATQTLASGAELAIDARVAAIAVAVVALLLRAPFIVVVALAAITAAGLRALGIG